VHQQLLQLGRSSSCVPRAQERRWRAAADGEQADCLLPAWHCSYLTEPLLPSLSLDPFINLTISINKSCSSISDIQLFFKDQHQKITFKLKSRFSLEFLKQI